jgi:DNA-binding GntR family transcriptional regulator
MWMLQLDERFHLALARSTRNPTLLDLVRTIIRRLAIARDMTPRGPFDAGLEVAIHERTLEAVRSRDPARIEVAMDEHMAYLEDVWEAETGLTLMRMRPESVGSGSPSSVA